MSATYAASSTFTTSDVSAVMRRVTADFAMIAQSTGAVSEAKARDYVHDIEALAQAGHLKSVDLTLLTGGAHGTEVSAATYTVNTSSGGLATSRPGGVMWPRVHDPYLRIVLYYNDTYDATARASMRPKLKVNWSPTDADTRHLHLSAVTGRNFVSNAFAMQRRDFSA